MDPSKVGGADEEKELLKSAVRIIQDKWKTRSGREEILGLFPKRFLVSFAGAIASRLRKTRSGAKKVPHTCPYCSKQFGARELREHRPVCPKNPRVMARRKL